MALTCLKLQRGTICKAGCRRLSWSHFMGFWYCCPRRRILHCFPFAEFVLLLNSAIRYTGANSKGWGVSRYPKAEIASFDRKVTQVFMWNPGLVSAFEVLGPCMHPGCVRLLKLGKSCLKMITASSYTPEIHPAMGSRQKPLCPVRYLVWIINDYIWVKPYSLSSTAYRDDWRCSMAILYFATLYCASFSLWGTCILGAPFVNVNVICKAFKSESCTFLAQFLAGDR